ncbi:MAG: methyltransferase domain-containing protein [DPANN group archaeon]|nr:methyltransferase domain-containing protein [DPANN group archaeon]
MKTRIVDLLICPYCKTKLLLNIYKTAKNDFKIKNKIYCKTFCNFKNKQIKNNKHFDCVSCFNTEIIEGNLKCTTCNRLFPIINGIPRILKDEYFININKIYKPFFKKYKADFNENLYDISDIDQDIKLKEKIATAFSKEWLDFNNMYKEYEKQFLTFIAPVKSAFFNEKLVLDGGCGSGRHVYYSSVYGAEVVGIDLGISVETAYKNTKKLPFTHIIQSDIYNIPIKKESFDFIYSIGVLHHLPNPKNGFLNLTNYLKKGGSIFAWVYGYENNSKILFFVDLFRKNITTKLPLTITKYISYLLTIPFYFILKCFYGPFNQLNDQFAEKILPINQHFFQMSGFSFNQVYSIVFDHLLAPIAFYYKKDEFKKWFKDANLRNIRLNWCRKNSWGGIGTKI